MTISEICLWIAILGNSTFTCYLFYRVYLCEESMDIFFLENSGKDFTEKLHEGLELIISLKEEIYKLQKELENSRNK